MIQSRSILLIFFIISFSVLGCQQTTKESTSSGAEVSKTDFSDFPDFWMAFQSAVVQEEAELVAAMTHFPLGSNGFFELSKADKNIFLQKYKDLFDAHAIAKIKSTKAAAVENYVLDKNGLNQPGYKNAGLAAGSKIYKLSVFYVYGKEGEDRTESSVTYHFGLIDGYYRLFLVVIAG